MMTQARMVPVGSNPKMFVRTDRVIGMEIVTRYAGTGKKYILTLHMDGMTEASVVFDSEYEAAQAACALMNKINGAVS